MAEIKNVRPQRINFAPTPSIELLVDIERDGAPASEKDVPVRLVFGAPLRSDHIARLGRAVVDVLRDTGWVA